MINKLFGVVAISLLIFSCKEAGSVENENSLEESVKYYLLMEDSIEVKCEIIDTLYSDEVEENLTMLNKNLNLVQQDIDTLLSIIDTLAYQNLAYQETLYPESVDIKMAPKNLELANHKLKLAELKSKKTEFVNTRRMMLHLKRSIWANIAGFEVKVNYTINGVNEEIHLLTDANKKVID